MSALPVDLWVMDVEDESDLERVAGAVTDLFDGRFEWSYGDIREQPKGCVRRLGLEAAQVAAKALEAVGAQILIDQEAYDEDYEDYETNERRRYMNNDLRSIFTGLCEEAAKTRNDLEALERVAWYFEEVRGNNVPGDLFIRLRGGRSETRPWQIDIYAEANAVQDYHRDDLGGRRRAVAVTTVEEESFRVAKIRNPWTIHG